MDQANTKYEPALRTSTSESVTPPRKTSPLVKVVSVLIVVGLSFPVGARIKTAMANKKALDEAGAKAAQSAVAREGGRFAAKVVHGAGETWTPSIPFDGTLQPIAEASLAFKATGTMSLLKVKTGDYVKKGDLLAALDASEAHAQAKAATAQIKAAEANLALAKDNADRTNAMVKSGAAPQMQETQAKGQLDLTNAQLDGAQAQLALASAMIRNHTLVAPFNGFVTQAPTASGGLVGAGQALFQVKDVSRLRLVGTVSEGDVALVKLGSEVTVRLESAQKTVHAKVTTILPSLDPATRRVPVEAELENDPKDPILAGTFVRAHITGKSSAQGSQVPVVRLPASALRPGAQDEVLVVGDNNTLRLAKVVFTRASDGTLLVRSGVTSADAVLANPAPESKPGDVVEVTP